MNFTFNAFYGLLLLRDKFSYCVLLSLAILFKFLIDDSNSQDHFSFVERLYLALRFCCALAEFYPPHSVFSAWRQPLQRYFTS